MLKYEIDWSDALFPTIRHATDGGMTFAECRRKLLDATQRRLDEIKAHRRFVVMLTAGMIPAKFVRRA